MEFHDEPYCIRTSYDIKCLLKVLHILYIYDAVHAYKAIVTSSLALT